MKWDKKQEQILINKYPLIGLTMPLLKELGHSYDGARWKIKELKLKIPLENKAKIISESCRNLGKRQLIYEKVIDIKESEMAYVLGFLWADGCFRNGKNVQSITFCNLTRDVNEIKHVLLKTGNWNFSTKLNKYGNYQTKGYIGGYYSYKYLCGLGYYEKSHVSAEQILKKIPENLRHYWWRGYFDGDGCLKKHRLKHNVIFTSTKEQDWSFTKYLSIEKGNIFIQTKKLPNGKIWGGSQWKITNKKEVIKFLEYIYQGYPKDNIGFTRKYQIYKEKYLTNFS